MATTTDSNETEKVVPVSSKIVELNEARSELLGRIQSLKQELSELKKTLNVEVEQLRTISEFQDLRTTLQQQQEDVTVSLRNLGLQDVLDVKQGLWQETKIEEIVKEEHHVLPKDEEDNGK